MAKKISKKTKKKIWELYQGGVPIKQIPPLLEEPVSYTAAWTYSKGREKGYSSFRKYSEYLAREKGYSSLHEYVRKIALARRGRKKNRELSSLINRGLEKLGENRGWLAGKIGVSRQMVDFYCLGESYPRQPVLDRLYGVLIK